MVIGIYCTITVSRNPGFKSSNKCASNALMVVFFRGHRNGWLSTDIPALRLTRVIKDPVHLNIELTDVEYEILQLSTFDRLHHTKQMSLAYLVYPGAQTSRFLHSIGAMHIASKMAQRVLQSVDRREWGDLFDRNSDTFRLQVLQVIRLAALLHDVGHAPFSHAAEEIMIKCLTENHPSEVQKARKLFEENEIAKVPVHEYFSYKLKLKRRYSRR